MGMEYPVEAALGADKQPTIGQHRHDLARRQRSELRFVQGQHNSLTLFLREAMRHQALVPLRPSRTSPSPTNCRRQRCNVVRPTPNRAATSRARATAAQRHQESPGPCGDPRGRSVLPVLAPVGRDLFLRQSATPPPPPALCPCGVLLLQALNLLVELLEVLLVGHRQQRLGIGIMGGAAASGPPAQGRAPALGSTHPVQSRSGRRSPAPP